MTAQTTVLDPSRVAAQIVSGIGFLGAGIIITRRGAVHGLTTAAAVWESAAIGMAAGAGLLLLAGAVVALHFVSALAFNVVERELTARLRGTIRLHIIYESGRGVLRQILQTCGQRNWQLTELDADAHDVDHDQVGVTMTLSGAKVIERGTGARRRRSASSAVLPGRGTAGLSRNRPEVNAVSRRGGG